MRETARATADKAEGSLEKINRQSVLVTAEQRLGAVRPMENLVLALAVICAFGIVPIVAAVRLAGVRVFTAVIAWALYFGAFLVWARTAGSNWDEAFSWTMILNIFTGLGIGPVALIALMMKKVQNR